MFKTIIRIFISVLMLISPELPGLFDMGRIPDENSTVDMSKFKLEWEDDFNGTELDKTKWGYTWWETVRKGGFWHEDMISVRDGNLIIKADYLEEPLENYYNPDFEMKEYRPGWYTGIVTTRDKYEQCYGYFEIRCILPAATGMWSAFWMMNEGVYVVDGSGKDGTEVDVFESFYYKDFWWGNDAVISGIHYDGYGADSKGASLGKIFVDGNPYEEYNTYAVEWSPTEYIFYINGKETGRITEGGVSQNPQYLLVSCEFAGDNGVQSSDRHGTGEIGKTPEENWPAEFIVDYVRCYQYIDMPEKN